MRYQNRALPFRTALSVLALALVAWGAVGCAAPTATLPTTSASAPSATADPAAAIVGIYKTILPGASSPGIDATLYLNYDGTLRQVLDYLNEAPPLVEVGTWTAAADGTVTLTVTGQEGRPYDTPAVSALQHSGSLLTAIPDEDAPGAILTTWYEFGALATGNLEIPYDAQSASMRMERNLAEHYKAFLPSASCCGRDITLSLQTDGIAVLKSDYLNGEPPIEEVGTWEVTEPSTVRVTLNSQQDRVYDEPVVTDYVVKDGTLTDGNGLTLRSVYGYVMSLLSRLSNETATYVNQDEGVLTEQDLSEAEYDLPELGVVRLRAGRYEHQYGSGATEVNRAYFQAAGFGDLDGDGVDDAAAVIATEMGGSGSFYYLVAVLNQAGQPQQAGQAFLGDRVQLEYVGVEEGRIVVRMKVAAADDPMCCPSHSVTQVYQLRDGVLEMVEGTSVPTDAPVEN